MFQLALQQPGKDFSGGTTLTGALFSDAVVILTLSIVLVYSEKLHTGQCFGLLFLPHHFPLTASSSVAP